MHKILFPLPGLLLLACLSLNTLAADVRINIQALFKDQIMVNINGKSRLLKVGETSPEGVKLIRSDSMDATLEIDGEQWVYSLGGRIVNEGPTEREHYSVRIGRDQNGAYQTEGWINNYPVQLIVDTGATTVAMNENQATALGLSYQGAPTGMAETAGGVVKVYAVRLDSIRVGEIVLNNVQAAVLEGRFPVKVLLGMSFLSRLELRQSENFMELIQKP